MEECTWCMPEHNSTHERLGHAYEMMPLGLSSPRAKFRMHALAIVCNSIPLLWKLSCVILSFSSESLRVSFISRQSEFVLKFCLDQKKPKKLRFGQHLPSLLWYEQLNRNVMVPCWHYHDACTFTLSSSFPFMYNHKLATGSVYLWVMFYAGEVSCLLAYLWPRW